VNIWLWSTEVKYKSLIQPDGGEGCNEPARGCSVMTFLKEAVLVKVRGDEQKSS